LDTHYCSVGIHPIGIDIVALQRKISNPEVDHWVTKLKEKYAGKRLIVARDKLDYIKGVRQKLLAFEEFLIRHPEWRGKVVLIQIALSTSEQNELRAHISDVVSRINFKFSTISYQPIVFLHQDISFSQYLALLTCADTCLLTPLRDGMNLTSHEYIVCQRETHNPLILSEFTGTYGSFGASIRVNPWDYRVRGGIRSKRSLMFILYSKLEKPFMMLFRWEKMKRQQDGMSFTRALKLTLPNILQVASLAHYQRFIASPAEDSPQRYPN
jgi:trehalose 6-phosphate synthase/phosphatase